MDIASYIIISLMLGIIKFYEEYKEEVRTYEEPDITSFEFFYGTIAIGLTIFLGWGLGPVNWILAFFGLAGSYYGFSIFGIIYANIRMSKKIQKTQTS